MVASSVTPQRVVVNECHLEKIKKIPMNDANSCLDVFVWGGEELKEEEIHLGKQKHKENYCIITCLPNTVWGVFQKSLKETVAWLFDESVPVILMSLPSNGKKVSLCSTAND